MARATDRPQPDWLHHMTQIADVAAAASNAYAQLALVATDRPQWRRFAEQAERHTLDARQARSDRYERSRVVMKCGSPEWGLRSASRRRP